MSDTTRLGPKPVCGNDTFGDSHALERAGARGHTIAVVGEVKGERRLIGESDSIAEARDMKAEGNYAAIYRATPEGWKLTA